MQQFNLLRFFTDKRARQWEKTPDEGSAFVFYETGHVPSFCLILPSNPDDAPLSFDGVLCNSDDVEVYTLASGGTSYKDRYMQYIYVGAVIPDQVEDNYYFKVTIGSTIYYSEVFVWKDSVEGLLKFEVSSSDVKVSNKLIYMMQQVPTIFYLNAEYLGLKPSIDQEGVSKDGVTSIIYGSRVISRDFDVQANESTYIYLSALSLIQANGLVYITWGYETWTATEILVEELDNNHEGIYQIKLSFVDSDETMSMSNSI